MNLEESGMIKDRIRQTRERIAKAVQTVGRSSRDIELIVVTKEKPAVLIKELYENGITKIGESYLKEGIFKINLLKEYPIEWHFIGNVQSGKESQIVNYFSEVHSVNRYQIANTLNKKLILQQKVLPIYLEFNVSGELTKHGWNAWRENEWEELLPDIEKILDLENIRIKGLMTMAPYSPNPEDSRPYFRKLRILRNFFAMNFPKENWDGLSMGMSGDFEVAIEEGATALRIGSAIVGPR